MYDKLVKQVFIFQIINNPFSLYSWPLNEQISQALM